MPSFMTHLVAKAALTAALVLFGAVPAHAQDAAALTARHNTLRDALAQNAFQRPLYLESNETQDQLKGDIYVQIAQSYGVAGPAMRDIGHWCDLLILHLNVKDCFASTPGQPASLNLNVGRKFDQPLEDTYPFDFLYRVLKSEPDYLQVELTAEDGPIGTYRYRMVLEIVALDSGHSFLHLSYAYRFGLAARMAMRGYLATIGREKRGFSIVGHDTGSGTVYIGGTRGVIERNTMRYFIAIEAYLGALSTPEPQRLEKRLNDWYAGIERYSTQLHELERDQYLSMKRKEVRRMETLHADRTP
ncbi:hypothetical protein E4T66_10265 [Sinimarinibacterium sp. CAU 1509]|nr:hypothetical protein E4T66_10265 [Sinimarinibacterium sp. CAU 1509]